MAHLIDKSALVAEIESHIREIKCITTPKNDKLGEGYLIGEESAYKAILSFLDTLEVKSVDLKKELNEYGLYHDYAFLNRKEMVDFAKHFFELGLKKGTRNIWHSMDETPNYPCDILFVTNVDNMFLFRYMENGRPVDKETPYFNNILNGKCWCYCSDIVNK